MFKKAMRFFDCLGKAVAIVRSNAKFGSITKPTCATNAVMTEEASAAVSSVALVTACSPGDLAASRRASIA